MAKLTKTQAKLHGQACDLLAKDVLTWEDKRFVLNNWQESANHINGVDGAFFTPEGLANDFSIESCGPRIIDLCAGIGRLAFACWDRCFSERERDRLNPTHPGMTCVEFNPDYVAVGKKIMPEATWLCCSVLSLPVDIGRFDCSISNPPFGAIRGTTGHGPRYTGGNFEYKVIDVASTVSDYGAFIIPQMSAPFEYSGRPHYAERKTEAYKKFNEQTGITLRPNCGIDTSYYKTEWRGVSPVVEIVTADFTGDENA